MPKTGERAYKMEKQSYQDLMKLYKDVGEKEFRRIYTAQRDIVMKNLKRLSKSPGNKSQRAINVLKSNQKPAELRELDKLFKKDTYSPELKMKTLVSALSHINTLYFQPTYSLTGWESIYKKISENLIEAGYRKFSKHELEIFGYVMEVAREIYGRKNVPSDTILEMIDAGFVNELMKLSPKKLDEVLKKWEKGKHDNVTLFG